MTQPTRTQFIVSAYPLLRDGSTGEMICETTGSSPGLALAAMGRELVKWWPPKSDQDGVDLTLTWKHDETAGVGGRPPVQRTQAVAWLLGYLDLNGPTKAGRILEDGKQAGYATKTLRRAAARLEVVRVPEGGGPNCVWRLPTAAHEAAMSAAEERSSR